MIFHTVVGLDTLNGTTKFSGDVFDTPIFEENMFIDEKQLSEKIEVFSSKLAAWTLIDAENVKAKRVVKAVVRMKFLAYVIKNHFFSEFNVIWW